MTWDDYDYALLRAATAKALEPFINPHTTESGKEAVIDTATYEALRVLRFVCGAPSKHPPVGLLTEKQKAEALLDAPCPKSPHKQHEDPDNSGQCIYCACLIDLSVLDL